MKFLIFRGICPLSRELVFRTSLSCLFRRIGLIDDYKMEFVHKSSNVVCYEG